MIFGQLVFHVPSTIQNDFRPTKTVYWCLLQTKPISRYRPSTLCCLSIYLHFSKIVNSWTFLIISKEFGSWLQPLLQDFNPATILIRMGNRIWFIVLHNDIRPNAHMFEEFLATVRLQFSDIFRATQNSEQPYEWKP